MAGAVVDVWLVFRNVSGAQSRAWGLLADGFQHVEVWRQDGPVWIRANACFELTELEAHAMPPWRVVGQDLAPTFLRVRRVVHTRKMRAPFHFGPLTCVDGAKAILGMWAPFIYTPRQLYRRLTKR